MNKYITLNSKKYRTPANAWQPVINKPSTIRYTLLGTVDATYAINEAMEWHGQIEGPVTPDDSGWGTISDLRTTLLTKGEIPFTDHYGNSYYVHAEGPFTEQSLSSAWDSPSNIMLVNVRLLKGRSA